MAKVLDYSQSMLRRSDIRDATLDGVACKVVRRSLARSEGSPSEGVHQSYDGVYWVEYNPAWLPVVGSVLVAETIDFRVLSVEPPVHLNFWTVTVRGRHIELAGLTLNDYITRFPAVQTIGKYGQRLNANDDFDPDFLEVPCRIQPQPTAVVDTRGRRTTRREYHITISKDVELRAGDKLRSRRMNDDDPPVWTEYTEYSIVSAQSVKRIDELAVIVAFGVD